jgi:signal transduction histidine kinase
VKTLLLTENGIASRSSVEKLLNDNGFVIHKDDGEYSWIIREHDHAIPVRIVFCENEDDILEQLFNITDNEISFNAQAINAILTQDRKRIADELHDGLTGTLVALMMKVDKLKSLESTIEAKELCSRMQQMIRFMLMFELRQIINDEDPIALINNTFTDAVRDLCRDANSCGMGTFTLEVQDGFPDLTSDIKKSLYRIVQEMITNAIKYANAERIMITLEHTDSHLHLFYSDNGVGMSFAPDINQSPTIKHGRGIRNIMNRVEKLHGSIDFIPNSNKGLSIRIDIPL